MKKLFIIPVLLFAMMSCNNPDKESAFLASKYWVEKRVPAEYGEVTFPFADFRADDAKNGVYIIESHLNCAAGEIEYRAKMKYKGSGDPADHNNWMPESVEFINDPVQEYINQRKEEIENPDTTFHFSDEDEPIIRTRTKQIEPIEASPKETR